MLVTLRLVQDSSGAPPFFIDPENLSNRIESPSSRTHGLDYRVENTVDNGSPSSPMSTPWPL